MINYKVRMKFILPLGKLMSLIHRNKGIISRSGRVEVRMETVDETFQALVRDLSSLNKEGYYDGHDTASIENEEK